jgi:RNA polymerase sigma factor (sigma-70 family)
MQPSFFLVDRAETARACAHEEPVGPAIAAPHAPPGTVLPLGRERAPLPARRDTSVVRSTAPGAHAPVSPGNVATDERTLTSRALEGDTGAWNALIQQHNHRVVVSLLARGVRIDRAKDLAQETWLRLIEQQRAGRLTHLILPGLALAQAAFLSLEAARRDASKSAPLSFDSARGATDLVDPQADAEARLVSGERLASAERVLSRCSASSRAVFQLVYGGEGLSHAQVATKVGLSLQRVRQILCEVRKQLRSALEGDGHE